VASRGQRVEDRKSNQTCAGPPLRARRRSIDQAGPSFKKNDVSAQEPGKPDQERNEEGCAERCRRDAENQGVRNAFHHLVNADSTGSASAERGANGFSIVLSDFEFLKLSRERILASGKLGCLCCN
jgi:hypothetical protein